MTASGGPDHGGKRRHPGVTCPSRIADTHRRGMNAPGTPHVHRFARGGHA